MADGIREQVRGFIIENFLFGEEIELNDTDSLLDKGIIDSTGVLEIIDFLEATYDIHLATEELIPENLDSIDRLVRLIHRKSARRDVQVRFEMPLES